MTSEPTTPIQHVLQPTKVQEADVHGPHDVGALSPITEMKINPSTGQAKLVEETIDEKTGRRFYISGINPSSRLSTISTVFSQFGDVAYIEKDLAMSLDEHCVFVTFKKENSNLNEYLEAGNELKIDEDVVHAVMATPKKTQVFVGGLKPDFTAQILANFFSQYGPVFDAMVKYDPNTRISRCFGFVTFLDSDDIVQTLCKERFFSMYGKRIDVKRAVTRPTFSMRAKMQDDRKIRKQPTIDGSKTYAPGTYEHLAQVYATGGAPENAHKSNRQAFHSQPSRNQYRSNSTQSPPHAHHPMMQQQKPEPPLHSQMQNMTIPQMAYYQGYF